MIRATLTLVLIFSTVTAPRSARAEEDRLPPGDSLIHRGIELRKKGRDAEALDLFRKAYLLQPSPRIEAQIGLAEQALGDWAQAELHLKSALVTSDPWVREHQAVLDGALATIGKHLGSIVLSGGVPGAAVTLDGVAAGALPIHGWLRATPGEHRLDVTQPGYAPFSARPSLVPGQMVELTVLLTPLATAPTAAPPTGNEVVAPAPTPSSRRWLWLGLGAGAVAVVVLAVALGVAFGHGTDYASQARMSCSAPCMVYEVQ